MSIIPVFIYGEFILENLTTGQEQAFWSYVYWIYQRPVTNDKLELAKIAFHSSICLQ